MSWNLLSMFCTRNIQNFLFYIYSIYRISSSSSNVKNILRYLRPIIFRTTKINYRKTMKPKETKSKRTSEYLLSEVEWNRQDTLLNANIFIELRCKKFEAIFSFKRLLSIILHIFLYSWNLCRWGVRIKTLV